MNIADLRQEYMRAGLSESGADADPFRQFEIWFEDALRAKLPLPNATDPSGTNQYNYRNTEK